MTALEALEKLLPSYEAYYNVKREEVTEPFDAEAEFFTHDVAYFLMKTAKLAQSESAEHVFFSALEHLDTEKLKETLADCW